MWIQDYDGNLVNLTLTAHIAVQACYFEQDKDKAEFKVTASTSTSNYESMMVYANLFYGTEGECQGFMERLTDLLGDKVLKV